MQALDGDLEVSLDDVAEIEQCGCHSTHAYLILHRS